MATRKELTAAVGQRYREESKDERTKILDEFVQLTKYHRKHAIRVLTSPPTGLRQTPTRNRLYDEAVRQALIVLWEAADRLCGKRLKALIPMLVDAMERHGHLSLDPAVKDKLLSVSVCARRWAASATLTTMQWPRASSPASSASSSTGAASGARPKLVWPSSRISKAGTTRGDGPPRSAAFPP